MEYLNRKISNILIIMCLILATTLSINAQKADVGQTFKGHASFYHHKFLGKKTASGEIFTRGEFTCAHKTLPFGTMIEVENPISGRWVVVRVNDRGPFAKSRVIDLSIDAAKHLGIIEKGVAKIKARIVGFNGILELLREGYSVDYYNCFLGIEEEITRIPYLPTEKNTRKNI